LDEAAAQLIAAWDEDLDAHAPCDDHLPKTIPSPDMRQARAAIANTHPRPSVPTAEVPTQSIKLPPGFAGLALPEAVHKRWPWALGAAAVVIALTVWGASGSDEAPPSVAAAPQQNAAQPAANPETGAGSVDTALDTRPKAASQARHTLVVRTVPPSASLRIDGVPVDNPYSAEHASREALHLVATAEGHQPVERDLSLTEDVTLMITLSPEAVTERPAVASTPKARPKRTKQAARKRRARSQKARAEQPKARRRPAKKSATGFVSSNPYR